MSYLKKRKNALAAAFSGLRLAFSAEPHLKIHVVAAVAVIGLGCVMKVSSADWIILLACITLVITLELVNSALEKLCDLVMPEQHAAVRYIKDVAAAAVLLACIFSVMAGVLVFWSYFS